MTALEAKRSKDTSQVLLTIHVCTACGTRVDIGRHKPGQKLPCPGCGTGFFVPEQEDPDAAPVPVPVPRVVRGPVVVKSRPWPWLKIAIFAGVAVAMTAGIVSYKRHKALNEITILPPTPAPSLAVENSVSAAPSSSTPVVASRVGVIPGIYVVKNVHSGLALDVSKYGTGLDAKIRLESAGGSGNQRWIFRPMSAGTWQIVSFHSLKALEVDSADDAARIGQGKLTGSSPQLWRLERCGDAFQIVAQGSGKAIAQIDDLPKGAHLGQRAAAPVPQQLWKLDNHAPMPAELQAHFSGAISKAPPVSAVPCSAPIDGRLIPIPLADVANADSREGLFADPNLVRESVHPLMTGWIRAGELPFQLLPASGKNLVLTAGGQGSVANKYPIRVEIPMGNVRLTKLHFLGGVASWGYPWGGPEDDRSGCVVVKVIVVRKGGVEEPMLLRNGIEFSDYKEAGDAPGSARVNGLVAHGRQVRVFSKALTSTEPIEKIILQGYTGHATPVFMAMTGETAR